MKNIIIFTLITCIYTIIAIIGANAENSITQGSFVAFIIITILSYLTTRHIYHIFVQCFLFYVLFSCITTLATLDEVDYDFWQSIMSNAFSTESLLSYISPTSSPLLPIFLGILVGGFLKVYIIKSTTHKNK